MGATTTERTWLSRLKRWIFPYFWIGLSLAGISKTNYYTHYARRDLPRRYQVLAGCASEEEFEQTGKKILAQFQSLGVKSSSRFLDLGCGTGRLASQLINFLSSDGLYYGCDVSREAVEFCRRYYRKQNFHFVRSEMTRIPIELDSYFDLVWCYSVFTHVYPMEMQLLLRECKRLLRPQGMMLASFYIAGRPPAFRRDIRTYFGNRDRMEYNESHLRFLVEGVGFSMRETEPVLKQPVYILSPTSVQV